MMPVATPTRIGVSPDAARGERVRREQARRNLLRFCQYVDPRYETPAHIQLVGGKLQQVARFIESGGQEGISRLMIELPPRHGKSEMASRKFPAWMMGRKPDIRVILASYGADLASGHSREVRNLVMSTRYQALFGSFSSKTEPVELSSDSRSVAKWDLAAPHRGGMVAAGVGGGITGLGADLLILDDLFKNREEGESEARREFVDDWYRSSAYTRLEQFAAVIIFFTRWHPDDQTGRLIRRMAEDPDSDQWEIVFLPALALELGDYPTSVAAQREKMREGVYLPLADPLGRKPGEALWPSRFPREWLDAKRKNVSDYEFTALYQQMPYAREGSRYKREWFKKIINKLPDGVRMLYVVRYWDKAGSPHGDFTSGTLMGYGSDGYFYMLDVVRGQWTSYERDQKMHKTAEKDRERWGNVLIWHQQDPGSAGIDSAQATNRVLMGFPAFFEPVTGSKEIRSEPLESAFQGGMVILLKGDWNEPVIEVYAAFPKGRTDDDVDSGSGAYSKLLEMIELMETPGDQEEIIVYEERVSISPL